MYEIQKDQTNPVNFFAGDFHVVTEAGDVKSGETVRKYAPVIKTADGISEATENGLANLHGIAAGNSTDGGVVCYLTGEFFADALILPDGVTVEALKPAFRKLGIFLK
ncbi:hypothetical protein [Acutalibacter intestini]|jgi:hypothetical protein|uniref:hypothetical protein n=1 Tax=Acutalibacter intestini TaxID=3093659 RepID=UPI002AC9EA05|nr:hypothetical protein [Acutalibacter sp. M00204]